MRTGGCGWPAPSLALWTFLVFGLRPPRLMALGPHRTSFSVALGRTCHWRSIGGQGCGLFLKRIRKTAMFC